jgi:UDP-glucose 4-epimerase
MKILVTGSSGHLGEALVRTLRDQGNEVVTHSMQEFVDTNVSGTLALLEEAKAAGVKAFVFTSTTSMFGDALRPPAGTPAAWVNEEVRPIPKNIYGTTKTAAEDLCRLFYRKHRLNCIILRTSRFFPEQDDEKSKREDYEDNNIKANEFLFRRVELEDVVSAHLLAARRAAVLGFGRYIISASTPFLPGDLLELNTNAPDVVRKRVPEYLDIYRQRGWKMFDKIDRVYVNEAARRDLGWEPKYDFAHVLECVRAGGYPRSPISELVGSKGYHKQQFEDGPYPVQ